MGDLVKKAMKVRGQPFGAAEVVVEIARAVENIEARLAALEATAVAGEVKTSKNGKGKGKGNDHQ